MKKYLLGAFAVVLALAFSAYKTVVADPFYRFNSTNFTLVEDETQWVPGTGISCSGTTNNPCQIQIPAAYETNLSGTTLATRAPLLSVQKFVASLGVQHVNDAGVPKEKSINNKP